MRRNSTYSDSNVIQKEPIPDGRPTALRKSGKSILSQSAVLRSSRPAAPVCGHSAKYPWLRGSMPAKQLHSFSFPFGYEPRCRLSASSAWSADARLRRRSHGIKYSNTSRGRLFNPIRTQFTSTPVLPDILGCTIQRPRNSFVGVFSCPNPNFIADYLHLWHIRLVCDCNINRMA